jgi:hypothetical protein
MSTDGTYTDITARLRPNTPPPPEAVVIPRSAAGAPLLADGCYLLHYGLLGADRADYEGTFRVDSRTGQLFASGDLYRRDEPENVGGASTAPAPASGIPIFPIRKYSLYLRVTSIAQADDGFDLVFEVHRFSFDEIKLFRGDSVNWVLEGSFTAHMTPGSPSHDFPATGQFFGGEVSTILTSPDGTQVTFGLLEIGLVSPSLRRATLEIDRVPGSELPLDNGQGISWETIFEPVGWDLTIDVSDSNITKPTGDTWTADDGHAAMLAHRARTDLNSEWRYYMLVVKFIQFRDGDRGVMFELGKDTPREALLLSSHYVFDANDSKWGDVRGKRAATTVTFFRTAVHETGHAMGLAHDRAGVNIMMPTDGIAEAASAGAPFPANIAWSFSADAAHRLRHAPDIAVRPGGVQFILSNQTPLSGTP